MKQQPLEGVLFYSYHPSDQGLREQLSRALHPLVREAHLSEWSAYHLRAGAQIALEREHALEKAMLVLLLVSSEYLASDACYQEMLTILDHQRQGEMRVIPILLRPCDWLATPLAALQSLPKNGRAVTLWDKREQAFFTLTQEIRQSLGLAPLSIDPRPTKEQHQRSQLIRRVRKTWIEGLLETSLHEEKRLHLHLQEQPDALVNPWGRAVQELDHETPHPLPEKTSIVQVYEEAEGELLLLGEPGAGKTTLLLSLARTLLDRAQRDLSHPIPVVLHLSSFASWAQKHKRIVFAGWIVEELQEKYRVSRNRGQSLQEKQQLIFLLDGLDEVAQEARDACVQAIIEYQQNHHSPLVICCRRQEYAALPTHFPFNRAVSILPLTDTHIEQVLQQAGSQLATLREALQTNVELAELARCPLMLTIFALTYQNATASDLPRQTESEPLRSTIFSHYAQNMLTRRGRLRTGTREQFLQHLIYLAHTMQRRHRTLFRPKDLVPDWIYVANARQRGVTFLAYLLSLSLAQVFVAFFTFFLPFHWGSFWFNVRPISLETLFRIGLICYMITSYILGIVLAVLTGRVLTRFLLWRFGRLPWQLVPFLDEAVERLLLRKAGESYLFTHPLLQEYLATQGEFQENSFFQYPDLSALEP